MRELLPDEIESVSGGGVRNVSDCKTDAHAGFGAGGALGAIAGGAIAGIIDTAWAGPGALLGGVIGAGVGLYFAYTNSSGCGIYSPSPKSAH